MEDDDTSNPGAGACTGACAPSALACALGTCALGGQLGTIYFSGGPTPYKNGVGCCARADLGADTVPATRRAKAALVFTRAVARGRHRVLRYDFVALI